MQERDERLAAAPRSMSVLVVDADARRGETPRNVSTSVNDAIAPRLTSSAACRTSIASEPAGHGERVEHPDRVFLRQPERDETMRGVIAAALRRRAAGQLAHQRHERRVEDRDDAAPAPAPPARPGRCATGRRPCPLTSALDARKKPMNIEPQSPMKIDAGLMVVDQEPEQRAGEGGEHQRLRPLLIGDEVHRRGNAPRSPTTPAARPSMLSSMFTAFVMPTSQKSVISTLNGDDAVHGSTRPNETTRGGAEELADQLLIRLDVQEVVDQSDQEERDAGGR